MGRDRGERLPCGCTIEVRKETDSVFRALRSGCSRHPYHERWSSSSERALNNLLSDDEMGSLGGGLA